MTPKPAFNTIFTMAATSVAAIAKYGCKNVKIMVKKATTLIAKATS
eukprot:CAMPEP_0178772870 /NCGR_PEP_ID=MMETSP0744-20121128/22791_1 /TAXON_ID=913974 /ORGANISM="Nitzschia punctata, Strain CCMP561" /LENGTH=45 /DNA_ID= /DNA_START= /DNA_END= /DNA_ORIENTATION=